MKVVFVYPSYENLGIEYLSASLKRAGHETALVFDPALFDDTFSHVGPLSRLFSYADLTLEALVSARPDVVAFSIVSNNVRWFQNLARRVRERLSVPIVAGGPHCSAVPHRVLEDGVADYVIRGEGDHALVELVDSLAAGRVDLSIRNLCYREGGRVVCNELRPPIADLDALPWLDKSLYDATPLRSDDYYATLGSRGCPYRCSFCVNNHLVSLYSGKGRYYRRRSVDGLLAELRERRSVYRFQSVNFLDEVFDVDRAWTREFAAKYPAQIGLPFICCVYPSRVDAEGVELLKSAGCVKVDMGVQSTNEAMRRDVLLRHESNEDVARAIRLFREAGLPVYADNIINLPGETEDDLVQMARFYNEHRPHLVKVLWLTYFPGTRILDHAVDEGLVTPAEREAIEHGRLGSSPARGGSLPSAAVKQFAWLFLVMSHLPPRVVETILARRLYRHVPDLDMVKNFLVLLRVLNKARDPHAEMVMNRYRRQYAHYALRKLRSLLP